MTAHAHCCPLVASTLQMHFLFAFAGAVLDEEAAEEVLPAAGLVTASADYYPTVAINALMRTLRDPGMAPHHAEVVRALFYIFQALGLSSVPYLPKVCTTGWTA